MAELYVELVSPDRALWAGQATMVVARTTEGELGVLPGHTSVLGELVESTVRVKRSGKPDLEAVVQGGFLSVTPGSVYILAERLEVPERSGKVREPADETV